MAGEQLRGAFADEGHAEGVDPAREAGFFAVGDFVEQILRGFFAHAIEVAERFKIESVEIGVIFDQALFEKLDNDFIAEAVDIHGVARGEVQQRFAGARRAGDVDAAIGGFAFGVMHVHAADRTIFRHLEFDFFGAMLYDFEDVRDNFAGAFDQDGVSSVNVEAANFIEIVQRGFDHGDAADLHRLENGEGREHAGAADADHDFAQQCGFLVRLILVGDGPARRFRGVAELVLQTDFVDLDDDAVDVEAKLFAFGVPFGDVLLDLRQAVAKFPIVADFETHFAESFENFGVAFFRDAAIDQQVVGEEIEVARFGDVGVEDADRAGGGVARIGVAFGADGVLLLVHGVESLAGHDRFAANFERAGQAGFLEMFFIDPERDGANGAHVGRDVFAGGAISASDGANQRAIFVNQRHAEAIKFMFGDVFDFFAAGEVADAAI